MEKPTGFLHKDQFSENTQRVYFMEYKGKDISFDRWRFDLYYAPNFAMTHFEYSENAAMEFLNNHKAECFSDYSHIA